MLSTGNWGMFQSSTPEKKGDRPQSPFFRPSLTKKVTLTQTISTPQGRNTLSVEKRKLLRNESGATDLLENKSSILGTYANLVNTIVGAGIIGVPYALNESGLVAGLILVVIVAILTDKSLRMLIETGKHANVQSYETLLEAAFGRAGFVFISFNMFLMSYGACIAYLLVLKDSLPIVFGIEENDEFGKRMLLVASSLTVILPLSLQRDMADLSKTSSISVCFDLIIVFIIAVASPIKESVQSSGGIKMVLEDSMVHGSTLFVGLGVLSFAFVCQDSSFIIAGSLKKPTKNRWSQVTGSSLFTCATLAIIIGVTGYLGFQGETEGNILNNFHNISPELMMFGRMPVRDAVVIAKGLLGLTMFCVYPLSSYVARHALMVLLFSGRNAHEGDDHTVLARNDRRIFLTVLIYISAIIPAIRWSSLGIVLSVTGTIAGSCLSYLGPGVAVLGVHGGEFLNRVEIGWHTNETLQNMMWKYPDPDANDAVKRDDLDSIFIQSLKFLAWYPFLMPLWCTIASVGESRFEEHLRHQALKSPAVQLRLGKIARSAAPAVSYDAEGNAYSLPAMAKHQKFKKIEKASSFNGPSTYSPYPQAPTNGIHDGEEERSSLLNRGVLLIPPNSGKTDSYGSTTDTSELEIIGEHESDNNTASNSSSDDEDEEDPQNDITQVNFVLAILYVILGLVALFAGLISLGSSR
eukprot:CAMPEP_0194091042 /NCGR_PEP_ID=MMETSP0149-20130528/41379_1 /TAXON_ID=122233 /ORGANISM="Chaetoceros debilis, Strain MM31A-1" /LENGTH=692 /DNA_ID=CAMNT_0038775497 /DNA_START=112 /DNA_END=2190 /DNA_ORIENTATION=+